jgi:hypothetical protein
MPSGKLEKMKIYAYPDSKTMEQGGKPIDGSPIEVLINPESFTMDYKLKFAQDGQGQGTSGQQLKYEYSSPGEMSFEFLFDCTGIIDGKRRENVAQDIADFKKVLLEFKGDTHEPPHIKLAWGNSTLFKGRLTSLSINYKLFSPDGQPLRAVAKASFKQSIEEEKRAAQERRSSPDLTHVRMVKAGDTLPLMCQRIYGSPKFYLQVAAANGLKNFRQLMPGTELFFPPVKKG